MSQMIFSGSVAATSATKSHGPVDEQVVDDRSGRAADVVLELRDHAGGERAGDDPPQPGVPGIVHVDHRPEVLVELDRQVRDAGRALGGGEDRGVLARLDHVRVLHQGVVTPSRVGERALGLGEERRPRLGPQLREGGRPVAQRQAPELRGRQVDPGNSHHAMPSARTCSYFSMADRGTPELARSRGTNNPERGARAGYAGGVTLPSVPMTTLGASGLRVSRLALGSWRTFERIGRDQGVSVMTAARDAGITFLDDARYNDETGHAPMPTGYSEVVFGELFRAAGWRRGTTVVAPTSCGGSSGPTRRRRRSWPGRSGAWASTTST